MEGLNQVVFLLILGAVAFIRFLYEKSQEAQARRNIEREVENAPPRLRRAPEVSEPERLRRLRDALGLPKDPDLSRETVGPVVLGGRPRLEVPPGPPPVPALTRQLEEATRRRAAAEREAEEILRRVPATVPRLVPAHSPAVPTGRFGPEIRRKLRDPRLAAESIVLGEILGPPRAFAPLGQR